MAKGSKKGAKASKGPKKSKKSKDGSKKKKGSKSKKGKKGPLSKKDMELAKMRAQKEEQERLAREAEEKAAAEKKLAIENKERDGHLAYSSAVLNSYDKWVVGKQNRNKALQEWKTFKACRNIPDFNKLYEVNSYLAYWLAQLETPQMKRLLKLSPEFLQLLSELQGYLLQPSETLRPDLLKELGLLFRDMIYAQQTYVNKCTYAIISDLSELYDPEVGICDYLLSIPEITHSLWGNIFCCPDINEHDFLELKFKFRIPDSLLSTMGVYRLIKTEYDHFSDSCLSYYAPGDENALKQSILDWVELHKLAGGDYTGPSTPEEAKESKKKKSKDKKKKGKKGKKRRGSKKGKKRKKSKSKGGQTTSGSDYSDMDEETRKFYEEMDKENLKNSKGKKGKGKGKKGKGKKGKKGGETTDTDATDYGTTSGMDTDVEEVASTTADESKDKKGAKSRRMSRKQSMADAEGRPKETKEERRERRRLEREAEENKDFDFGDDDDADEEAKKKKDDSDSDDDEKKPKGVKKAAAEGEPGGGGVGKKGKKGKKAKDDDSDSEIAAPQNKSRNKSGDGNTGSQGEASGGTGPSATALKTAAAVPKAKSPRKSKSKKKGKKRKSKSKSKKGKKGKKSKSKSKKGKKGKKSKSKKGKKGRSKSVRGEKAKAALAKARDGMEKEKKGKKMKGAKSRSKSKDKSGNESGGSKGKRRSKGRKGSKSKGGKGRKGSKGSKGRKGSKSSSKGSKKGKGKKDKSKSKSSKGSSRGRSKEKKKGRGSKSKSKSSKSSKSSRSSKSSSRSKSSRSSKSSKSKGKKGKRGSKSRSRSKKRKGKGKKGKKGKSKSKERPKTEAELAKERERAEKAQFIPQLHDKEMNLRNYTILGGVYHFNLLEVPQQPKSRGRWVIHIREDTDDLKEVPFEADYVPPTPPDQESAKKTPEEMEKEAKRQEEELQKLVLVDMALPGVELEEVEDEEEKERLRLQSLANHEAENERRLNQLIFMTITAPKIALWFEPPTPVRWDPYKRIWSTDGFYDVKFNESNLELSFRTVRFGTLGLGHNRWSNLPYQSWELKPLGKDKVTFSLVAAIAVIEFIVMGDLICVSAIGNVTCGQDVEAALLNKYMKPKLLIKTMRYHGLDLFPEPDSYAYVDGILIKNIEAEDHLYRCMAVVSSAFNFQWSRWNLLAGREKMVYQMRERHGSTSPGNYSMVLNTPRKSVRINCTEVSPTYTEELVAEFEYYADLINLCSAIGTDQGLKIINTASPHHVEAVRILISSIRPLSFS